jgi:hypothetical protein
MKQNLKQIETKRLRINYWTTNRNGKAPTAPTCEKEFCCQSLLATSSLKSKIFKIILENATSQKGNFQN